MASINKNGISRITNNEMTRWLIPRFHLAMMIIIIIKILICEESRLSALITFVILMFKALKQLSLTLCSHFYGAVYKLLPFTYSWVPSWIAYNLMLSHFCQLSVNIRATTGKCLALCAWMSHTVVKNVKWMCSKERKMNVLKHVLLIQKTSKKRRNKTLCSL